MKKQEMDAIHKMRLQGKTASEIGLALGISVNTVRAHIRRHPEIYGGMNANTAEKPSPNLQGGKGNGSAPTGAGWAGGTVTGSRFGRKHITH